MVSDKVADIEQTGAARVLSGDCGCLMNIGGALEYRNLAIPAQHIAEFIRERTHG
jgi:L-lactate dehydrogenase complex protein LldE